MWDPLGFEVKTALSQGDISASAPANAYSTRNGSWALIGANSEPLFAKLAS
jgi:hypothetical protein